MAHLTRRSIRILAADDSTVMREVLRMVFSLHAADVHSNLPRMELCGVARDGLEALEAIERLAPDVLLLDVEMPRMGGLAVLQQLRKQRRDLPVILCSAHTEAGAQVTLEALALGARDYVMKPAQQSDFASALDTLTAQLLPRIAALAGQTETVSAPHAPRPKLTAPAPTGKVDIVVIGVSTGGPSALEQLLPALPADFPVPVLIVQHMPKLFTAALAARLNKLCRLPVSEAADGAPVRPGSILLAPGDAHMEIKRGAGGGPVIRLHQGPMLNSCKPSVDYLFQVAAELNGSGTLALVMTGMGQDGFTGAEAIVRAGGTVLAQDEATSAVWGMPGRVSRAGLAAETLPLPLLADCIKRRVSSGRMPFANRTPARAEVTHGMH